MASSFSIARINYLAVRLKAVKTISVCDLSGTNLKHVRAVRARASGNQLSVTREEKRFAKREREGNALDSHAGLSRPREIPQSGSIVKITKVLCKRSGGARLSKAPDFPRL